MTSLFILIDALGWAYLKDRSFLSDVLTYRTEVRTVLGFSSAAIPSLLTGLSPRETGHWNLFYYDPEHSPFRWARPLRWLPSPLRNHRVMRRGVRFLAQHFSRFGGYFQIYGVPVELLPYYDICEKRDIYRPGGVAGSIFERLEKAGVRYRSYSYHHGSDEQIIDAVRRDLRHQDFDFGFVYLAELDAFLHRWCKDHERVDQEIGKYERWLRDLYLQATAGHGRVSFCVFSDHGMTPKKTGYDLIGDIDALGLTMPDEYLALYDSTMARFWFFNSMAQERIAAKLATLECGHVLSTGECRQLGIDFDNDRFGQIIFLMNPGVLIEPSFMGGAAPEGMHGFHPDECYSSAAFLSNSDPGREIRDIRDIHAVMLDAVERLKANATRI